MRCLDNTLSKPNNTLFLLVKIRFLIVALVLSFLDLCAKRPRGPGQRIA